MLIPGDVKHISLIKRARKTKGNGAAAKRRNLQKEQYSVIIASETDARKKTLEFLISRRAVAIAAAVAVLVVGAFAVLTIMSVFRASYYSAQSNELKNRITTQSSVLDTYAEEIDALSSDVDGWREKIQLQPKE
jgi:cell division septal protein FtsQ